MKIYDSVYSETFFYTLFKTIRNPQLRSSAAECVLSILKNFFLRQYQAALMPGRIPVAKADHFLDGKVPFVPSWDAIYHDFVKFWVRMLSFFLRRYGRKAHKTACDFYRSMGRLYAYAGEVYTKTLSTTKRPFYIARPRFALIHLLDPHLMCIPSLHVMIAAYSYRMFGVFAKDFGEEGEYKEQINEMKYGAAAICRSVLFIKQHSINCIPAALYAVTCFVPELFPQEEAESFIELLFASAPSAGLAPQGCSVHPCASPSINLPEEDREAISSHILNLYKRFLSEKEKSKTWNEPVLNFLRSMPQAR